MESTEKRETLEKFAVNITTKAVNGELDKIFGREKEFDELCKTLLRKKKNNVILVGLAGVGKTLMVELLAKRIHEQKVPHGLLNKIIYSIDSASITAGTTFRGMMEERLKKLLHECESDDNIILFIDEIHTILDSGGSSSMNIANIMKPHLTSGKLQVIGATTTAEYEKYFAKDGALSRRFNKLVINEPSEAECVEILKNCIDSYEEFHGVHFSDELINKIPKMAKKYLREKALPDSAMDIIDIIGAGIKVDRTKPSAKLLKLLEDMEGVQKTKIDLIKNEKWEEIAHFKPNVVDKLKDKISAEQESFMNKVNGINKIEITEEDLLRVVSKISKIPLDKLNKDGRENIKKLEEVLNKELVNQDEAKNKILKVLKKKVLNLDNSNKPVSFLFAGKTGSGKTFISLLIAKEWFGNSMIRIDGSQFSSDISITNLLGSSPGYVGFDNHSTPFDEIRRNPHSLLLSDEIEKMSKPVITTLLTILDEGYIVDNRGVRIDFNETLIVLTSNLGAIASQYIKPGFGGGNKSDLETTTIDSIKKFLAPELFNRIDSVVVFNSLTKDDMYKILDIEIEKFKKKLKDKNISITINKKVSDYIISKGFDENLGARPLKRAFESVFVDKIIEEIIDKANIKKIKVNMNDTCDELVIESK